MSPRHVALALLICLAWGINFSASKAAVNYFPPFFMLALRLSLVALVLLPFIGKPSRPIRDLAMISFVFTVVHFGLMFSGLAYGAEVSLSVIIDQLRVPFAVIFGVVILNETCGKRDLMGMVLAFIGAIFIVWQGSHSGNFWPLLMILGGAIAWGVYNVQVKIMDHQNIICLLGWVCLLGAPQHALLSWIFEDNQWSLLKEAPLEPILSLVYVALASTIFAHGSWCYLLRHYPVAKVVPFSLTVPLFGLVTAMIWFDEALTNHAMIGAVLVIVGVSLIIWKKPKAGTMGDTT